MKCYISLLFENLSRKFNFLCNTTRITATSHDDLSVLITGTSHDDMSVFITGTSHDDMSVFIMGTSHDDLSIFITGTSHDDLSVFITGTSHDYLSVFMIHRLIFLRVKSVSDKSHRKIKTHFSCSMTFFSSKFLPFVREYGKMW
jgi:hypothetical protein